jgi:beta-glucosidase
LNSFRLGLFENPYVDPDEATRVVGNPEFMQEGYEAQLRSIVMLKNNDGCLPMAPKSRVYFPKRHYPAMTGFWGEKYEERTDYPIRRELVGRYFTVVDNPTEADFALVDIDEPMGGFGYSRADLEAGGNGYVPISLQYRPYTASSARQPSIAGGDPKEGFTDRSYLGKTVTTHNESDLDLVLETKHLMGGKPVVVIINASRPLVLAEVEPSADAILLCFGIQNRAKLDIISGMFEPQGLLPFQMPADMETVENQCEDVPHDMRPYRDSNSHLYDFAFGLNWEGIISDWRTERYHKGL